MPGTILVADTDALVVRAVGAALQAEGYEVLTAAKASDALKTWGSGAPDLILVDAALPGPSFILEVGPGGRQAGDAFEAFEEGSAGLGIR